jgi:transcriptional antiterminator NusG
MEDTQTQDEHFQNENLEWYTLRTFSGHEKKVRRLLEEEIDRLGLEDRLTEIVIPQEEVVEMRGGKKKSKQKTLYPGYIFLHADLNGELEHRVSRLSSVIGFLGGDRAESMREAEVNQMLGRTKEASEADAKAEFPYQVGDPVTVVDGPFSSFSGFVQEVFPEKMKVKVLVSIFGRKTPLELDYLQVEEDG